MSGRVSTLRLTLPRPAAAGGYGSLRASPDGTTYLLLGRDGGIVGPANALARFASDLLWGNSELPKVTSVATFDAVSGECLGSSRIEYPYEYRGYVRWFSDGDRFAIGNEDGGVQFFSRTCVSLRKLVGEAAYPIANGAFVRVGGGVVSNEAGVEVARYDGVVVAGDFAVAAAGNKWLVVRTSDWSVVRELSRTATADFARCSDGGEIVVETGGGVTTLFEGTSACHMDRVPYPFLLCPNGSRALRRTEVLGELRLWNVLKNRAERTLRGLSNPAFSRDGLTVLDAAPRSDERGAFVAVDSYDARFDCEIAADAVDALLESAAGRDVPSEIGLGVFSFASDDAECRARFAKAIRDAPADAIVSSAARARAGCVVS